MFADLNSGRDLLFSFIKSNCCSEKPVEQITNGFFVFSVKFNKPSSASALEKSNNTSYSTFISSALLNTG